MGKIKFSFILRLLVSLFLLALLLWLARENLAEIWQRLSSVNIVVFILAFVLFMTSIALTAWRLKMVLAVQAGSFNIRNIYSLTLIGYFFTNFMPTSVGGDLVKGYYISKKNKKRLTAYSSVFIDRVIGMFSVALIASMALLIMRVNIEYRFIIWVIVLLLICCVAFAVCLFQEKLLKKITNAIGISRLLQALRLKLQAKKLYEALQAYANHKEIIVKAMAFSIVAQFISFFSVFLLAKSLYAYVPLGKIFLVMPVIFVLCMLPITINGLGLREWAFKLFFSSNIGDGAALSLSLLYLAMFLLMSLVGGAIYLFYSNEPPHQLG